MKLSHRHHGSQTTVRVMKPLVAHLANTLCLWQSCTYVGYLSVGEWWGLPNTERHLRLCPESSEEVHASKRDKRELSHVEGTSRWPREASFQRTSQMTSACKSNEVPRIRDPR
jgi:hypothetical protein